MVSRGKSVFSKIQPRTSHCPTVSRVVEPNDLILYALLARLTLDDNRIIEFETKFDKKTQTIELQIAEKDLKFFDQMMGMKRGPKFKRFIDWLIGSKRFESQVTPDFISATAFDIWFGATESVIDNTPLVLFPTSCASHIGYNLKLREENTKAKINMIWQFICGSNTSFELRVNASVTSVNDDPVDFVSDISVSTSGLSPGDQVETNILDIDVPEGSIIGLSLLRNFEGSSDPKSEMFGLIGVRIDDG